MTWYAGVSILCDLHKPSPSFRFLTIPPTGKRTVYCTVPIEKIIHGISTLLGLSSFFSQDKSKDVGKGKGNKEGRDLNSIDP